MQDDQSLRCFVKSFKTFRLFLFCITCLKKIKKYIFIYFPGKLSSLVGIVENLSPLLYVPLYAKVYLATMEALPGAVFLVGGLLMLPAVVVLRWAHNVLHYFNNYYDPFRKVFNFYNLLADPRKLVTISILSEAWYFSSFFEKFFIGAPLQLISAWLYIAYCFPR